MGTKTTKNCCQWKLGKVISDSDYQSAILKIHQHGGKQKVLLTTIVKIEGDKEYCIFHLTDGSTLMGTNNLAHYCQLLPAVRFGRYCKFYIINLEHVNDFKKGENWSALLDKGAPVLVNTDCRDLFKNDFFSKKADDSYSEALLIIVCKGCKAKSPFGEVKLPHEIASSTFGIRKFVLLCYRLFKKHII